MQPSYFFLILILIFLYMWKSEDSWLEFEKAGQDLLIFSCDISLLYICYICI